MEEVSVQHSAFRRVTKIAEPSGDDAAVERRGGGGLDGFIPQSYSSDLKEDRARWEHNEVLKYSFCASKKGRRLHK